jgi:hypothetical protein
MLLFLYFRRWPADGVERPSHGINVPERPWTCLSGVGQFHRIDDVGLRIFVQPLKAEFSHQCQTALRRGTEMRPSYLSFCCGQLGDHPAHLHRPAIVAEQ